MAGVDWRDAPIDWRRSLVFLSYLGAYGHAEEMGPKKIIVPLLYLFLKLYPAHRRVRGRLIERLRYREIERSRSEEEVFWLFPFVYLWGVFVMVGKVCLGWSCCLDRRRWAKRWGGTYEFLDAL